MSTFTTLHAHTAGCSSETPAVCSRLLHYNKLFIWNTHRVSVFTTLPLIADLKHLPSVSTTTLLPFAHRNTRWLRRLLIWNTRLLLIWNTPQKEFCYWASFGGTWEIHWINHVYCYAFANFCIELMITDCTNRIEPCSNNCWHVTLGVCTFVAGEHWYLVRILHNSGWKRVHACLLGKHQAVLVGSVKFCLRSAQ